MERHPLRVILRHLSPRLLAFPRASLCFLATARFDPRCPALSRAVFILLQCTHLLFSCLCKVIPLGIRGITSYKRLAFKCVHCSAFSLSCSDSGCLIPFRQSVCTDSALYFVFRDSSAHTPSARPVYAGTLRYTAPGQSDTRTLWRKKDLPHLEDKEREDGSVALNLLKISEFMTIVCAFLRTRIIAIV